MNHLFFIANRQEAGTRGVRERFTVDSRLRVGHIGVKPCVDQVPDSIEEEAHLLMRDLERILAHAEMRLEHLVFLQVFSPDVALWAPFNEIYRLYFSGPMPPRSFIGS